jgi:hypothetical protein
MTLRLLLATGAVACVSGLALAQTQSPAPATPAQQPAPGAQQAPDASAPGVRVVDPTTLKLTFYTAQPADFSADDLIDTDVYNLQNEEIGEVEDLIIDDGKRLRALVISVGGFLGVGERRVGVEPASVVITRESGGLRVIANTTREDLKNAPAFEFRKSK